MGGIAGGRVADGHLQKMDETIGGKGPETSQLLHNGLAGLVIRNTPADPRATTTWQDDGRIGVVYGAISNVDELDIGLEELFNRLFERPSQTAEALEGSFLLACADAGAERVLVVTDKLGSRPCYYTEAGSFRFGSSVATLLNGIKDPTLDVQAVSDLLLMGHLWGDRTLVSEIKAIRPATIIEWRERGVYATRYWKPDYTPRAPDEYYLNELASRYKRAVGRTVKTLPGEAGIWLSGGLDSRTTAAALLEASDTDCLNRLKAYSYDANPPTNDNPRIAARVAGALGIEHERVSLSAKTFGEDLERVIDVTDGMLSWHTAANLSAAYQVNDGIPVLMEGMEGALIGDHLLRYHLNGSMSVVECQEASEASRTPQRVRRLLQPSVNPLASFKREADRTNESSYRGKVLDIHFQNYHPRLALLSNRVMHDRAENRVVQVDGDYLEWCAKLPQRFRKGSFPLSHRVVKADTGGIPYGTSPAKLAMCRRICPNLAGITYERTKISPSYPSPLHAIGFVGNVLVNRLRSKPTYANGQLPDFWIRDTESVVHRRVTELVDAACERDLFNADVVRDLYDGHMDGANNAGILATLTTLEYWIGSHLE